MSRGRLIKNTDKLLEKYGHRILAIYNRKDYWEICCWYAGPRLKVKGKSLPEALQKLERIVRGYEV
ncbi:MAG: hypothetical protein GX059_01000 [Clostridiales bacterium]|jgi:hypothetical protein|nr:hypothetical protein [Clostridiales bacterium]